MAVSEIPWQETLINTNELQYRDSYFKSVTVPNEVRAPIEGHRRAGVWSPG